MILADQAPRFADAVIELLLDAERRRALGVAAAELAARHDWSVVARHFEAVLARVAEEPPAAAEFSAGMAGVRA